MDLKDLTIEKLRGTKVAVHCKTQEEWDEVNKITEFNIIPWGGYDFEDFCCISMIRGFSPLNDYQTKGFEIIPASDFIAANRKEVVTELTIENENCGITITDMGDKIRILVANEIVGFANTHISRAQLSELRTFLNQLP